MRRPKAQSGERGYVLLAMLLFVALLSIGIFVSIQRVDFQIQRDREEELIHRGVQYSRAVRKYFKAFGRYPTRIEELESTNNQRFLRRRYKDPVTGKDFKLLRMTDVQMSFGSTPGIPVSQMNQQQGSAVSPDSNTLATGAGSNVILSNSAPSDVNGDASQPDQSASSGAPPAQQSTPQPTGPAGSNPQVFGGAGIVGVASVSKNRTIREFNKKNHYNQWQFIYDPTTDRGGLLMTPNQPPLMVNGNPNQPQNGTNPGPSTPGFGSTPGQPPTQQNQP